MAVDMGINLLDTADIYGNGDNEILVGEAIRGIRQNVVISSKFGFTGNEHGALEICGRPDYVKQACDASLKRLRTDFIYIYHLHRVDPKVPIDETVGAMAELIKLGKVRSLGLSEVSAVTLKKALKTYNIASLQSEYSLFTKEMEKNILPACKKAEIGVLAFSPLGRGFLTGKTMNEKQFEQGDYRRNLPRFKGKNLKKNLDIVEKINAFATDKGVTASQLSLSWLMHQGSDVFPLIRQVFLHFLLLNFPELHMSVLPQADPVQ